MIRVAGVIVHCTDGNHPTSADHALAIWRNVQAYHMDSPDRGYDDVAYNWAYDDFGQILEGRGRAKQGAHSGEGWNDYYHGICYLGDGKRPTALALCALHRFFGIHDGWYQDGEREIIGHRNINRHKECPGQGNYDYLVEHYGARNPHITKPAPVCPHCGQCTPVECTA